MAEGLSTRQIARTLGGRTKAAGGGGGGRILGRMRRWTIMALVLGACGGGGDAPAGDAGDFFAVRRNSGTDPMGWNPGACPREGPHEVVERGDDGEAALDGFG